MPSGEGITWATDAYHRYVDPILVANPKLITLSSTVGIIIVIAQLITMFFHYKKNGFRSWMLVVLGTTVLSTALIAPQSMLPFWLGLFDFFWDLVFGILDIS